MDKANFEVLCALIKLVEVVSVSHDLEVIGDDNSSNNHIHRSVDNYLVVGGDIHTVNDAVDDLSDVH